MTDFFRDGGYGMYPTVVFGAMLVVAAAWYAAKLDRRGVPLVAALGVLTMSAGLLGFATGLRTTCQALSSNRWPLDQRLAIVVEGFGESIANVVLALALVTMAAMAACLGAWRLASAARLPQHVAD